jgi:hypothetical protein
MALIDLLWMIPLTVVMGGLGIGFHESCHYVGGLLSGGTPRFSRYSFGVPTQTDFLSPHSMSNLQVRITGGVNVLWLIISLSLFGYMIGTGSFELTPVFWFFFAASIVSWLDILAAKDPELWKRFTAGDAISREDLS